MKTIIDDDFGDLSIINIVYDEIPEEVSTNPLIDDDFGDLSVINIVGFEEELSEITLQPDPIDPVKAGIEVIVNSSEVISTNETTVLDTDVSLGDVEQTIKLGRIKSYQERIKDLPLYEQAEAAINESVDNPLFFSFSHSYLYTKPYDLSLTTHRNEVKNAKGKGKDKKVKEIVAMPTNVDTEYQTWLEEYAKYFSGKKKLNLTVQIAGIHRDVPKNIYSHWHIEQEGLPSHFPQLTKSDSCVWERYLRDNNYAVKFKLCDSGIGEVEYLNVSQERVFQIPVYGHMLQADFMGCWQPKSPFYRYFERIISGRDKSNYMSGRKRLEAESNKGELLRPRIILIDGTGEKWAIEFIFVDTQSIHGIGKSLAEIAQVTKTDIADDKKLYVSKDKERMLAQYLKIGSEEKFQISDPETNTVEYITERERYTRYASGADLSVYQILINNVKAYWNLYTNPAIDAWKYFKIPQLTIGRSVADIIKARLLTYFEEDILSDLNETIAVYTGYLEAKQAFPKQNNPYDQALYEAAAKLVKEDEKTGEIIVNKPDILPRSLQAWIIDTFCVPSSAMNLAGLSDTRRLNAKIQGGRAFRNRPLDTVIEGVIGEPDLGGAYNSMMRALEFPLCANPFMTELSLKGRNEGMSLGQFREKHKDDLLPGLYQIWSSCIEDERNWLEPRHVVELSTPQDLIPSFHPHSSILNTTTGGEWLHKYNESYHYSNEITNGIFTHWNLQIINTVFSKELKNSIETGKVITSIMYRKGDKVDSVRKLLDNYRCYKESNRYKVKGDKEIISRDLCRSWYGINIGDLIATPIRVMRNSFPKGTPENTFFKLIGNTVYGVLCSKYFDISNVVVANNITSGVRTGVWCMEKGLHSQNSITDGGIPDLRKVAYAQGGYKLSDKNTVQTQRYDGFISSQIKYAPIGSYKDIEWKDDINFEWCDIKNKNLDNPVSKDRGGLLFYGTESILLPRKKAIDYVDQLIYEHLAIQFPKLDIWHLPFKDEDGKPQIGIMRIESKGIIKKAVCRGATDYLIQGGFHKEFKQGDIFAAVRSYRKGYGSHAQLFMEDLGNQPDAINRSEVFEQSMLLKIGLWQERYKSYFENSDYMVGDTIYMDKLIKEFSMSAFCFKTAEQRRSWKQEIQSLNQNKGQSIETFFLNEDGMVNTNKMNAAFDIWINAGYKSLSEALGRDKGDIRNKLLEQKHPEFDALQRRKTSKRQGKRE